MTIGDVLWNDFGFEGEELRVRRVDRNAHPMGVWITERLNAGEVFEYPIGFLAVERLVDAVEVSVSVEERDWLLVAFHFLGKRLDVVVVACWLCGSRADAAKEGEISLLRSGGPMVLETRIGLSYSTKPRLRSALAAAKACFIQTMFAALRSICSASISGVRPKLSLLPTM